MMSKPVILAAVALAVAGCGGTASTSTRPAAVVHPTPAASSYSDVESLIAEPTARSTGSPSTGALRMPHARPLGSGLYELRFTCEGTVRRVTYHLDVPRKITTLTTFRKQRQNERREVARARQALRASQQAGGTDG